MSKKRESSKDTSLQTVADLVPSREDILLEENKKLQLEINRLNQKLAQKAENKPSRIVVTDEELIAQTQLERIKFKAMEQELTLEEIKKFDLLVKNKRLVEGNPTMIGDYKKLPDDISDDDLIQLAAGSTKEELDSNNE